jgi:hypothetical protein
LDHASVGGAFSVQGSLMVCGGACINEVGLYKGFNIREIRLP